MSFASVFKGLQELFPQVDHRILKAVSIEHHKDVNAAVEFILSEVVPSTGIPLDAPHGLIDDKDDRHLPICSPRAPLADNQDIEVHIEGQEHLSEDEQHSQEAIPCHLESKVVASEPGDDSHCTREVSDGSTCLVEESTFSSNLSPLNEKCTDQLCVDIRTEEMTTKAEHLLNVRNRSFTRSPAASSSTKHDTVVFYECDNVGDAPIPNLDEPETYEINISVCSDSRLTTETNETENKGQLNSSCISEDPQELLQEAADSNPEARGSFDTVFEQTSLISEPADLKDESSSATAVAQSGKIGRIDVLEDAINEAKDNKKTLSASMESVINMMKKAEDLETAADEAKEEAVKGGVDTLAKVEELRKMLLHAKEANDMHAGEVYGEKAILATEARELQARLMNLFNERNSSLAILDEMRQVLEARLAVAEEIMKAVEQDKHCQEESARKALLEQELIMEKVVQESKRLQSEAEENSKLREFLMDRGQIVDVLQGEMAVICLDIKSLKENFEERAPLSKSLSSSQTSCILALSGSSGKSPKTPEDNLSEKSVDNLSEKSTSELSEGGEKIMDGDWALFQRSSTPPVEQRTSAWSEEDGKNLVDDDDWALPKKTSSMPLDNLSEKITSEWSDDWALPQTSSTMHSDNFLDDDWSLL